MREASTCKGQEPATTPGLSLGSKTHLPSWDGGRAVSVPLVAIHPSIHPSTTNHPSILPPTHPSTHSFILGNLLGGVRHSSILQLLTSAGETHGMTHVTGANAEVENYSCCL